MKKKKSIAIGFKAILNHTPVLTWSHFKTSVKDELNTFIFLVTFLSITF